MIQMSTLPLLAFMFTMLSFTLNNSHLLMSLLCLEGMMLSLVIYIPSVSTMMSMSNPVSSIILLTFGACEASLGLSIMVKLSRQYGSDLISNLSMNKC